MVEIEEQEDEEMNYPKQARPPMQASSSSSNINPNQSIVQHNPNPNPDSPSSASSISSDHTFHGFSPPKSPSPAPAPAPAPAFARASAPAPTAIVSTNRLIRDQPEVVTKTESHAHTAFAADSNRDGSGVAERKPRRVVGSGLSQARKGKVIKRVGLVLRLCEFVVCLISFSVMAADKRRGWALDSFDRYIEFRYAMTINVISFAYAGLQGLDLLLQLIKGNDHRQSQLRYCFDFAMDQILAYLLLSSSSSAFTRVDDWISNWGKDKFPAMASASVGVSFMAFIDFALSSLISGYTLCTNSHT